jgi:hypothetical protein
LNVDLIIATSLFVVFISFILIYTLDYQDKEASLQFFGELRREANNLANEIISQGNPPDWNKENVIPSKIGLASSVYLIPILISDTSGYNRINEPIAQEIVFDNDCKNLAWNGTVRIFDENFNEVPFRFVNQTFCPSGFLQKAILFFEVNVSANSTRKLQIFFYNSTQVNPKDYDNFSSLVMWLTFDEGSGNIVYDYSGNGNNGILYNGTTVCGGIDACPLWVDGKFGKALSFDGIDDWIKVLDSDLLNPSLITVSLWINASSFGNSILLSKNYSSYQLSIDSNGYVQFYINETYINSSFPLSISTWQNVAGRFNGSSIDIFINAINAGSKLYSFSIPSNSLDLSIAAWQLTSFFNGTIDDVRIYNRALTNEEILSHYQQPLSVKIFPRTEVSLISFEKLEALRNISYDLLKDALQKGYNFRVEIYEK